MRHHDRDICYTKDCTASLVIKNYSHLNNIMTSNFYSHYIFSVTRSSTVNNQTTQFIY